MCPALIIPARKTNSVKLVFVSPYDADTRLVDRATGSYGYGHVAMWAGHVSNGEPMVFDAGIGYGVGFRPYSIACAAPTRSYELDEHLSRWVWRRALQYDGCTYDYKGLVLGRRPIDAFTCSGLVAACLPEHMRCELPGRVSPNDLARYFNVPPWR
jgi:hypothetical protein